MVKPPSGAKSKRDRKQKALAKKAQKYNKIKQKVMSQEITSLFLCNKERGQGQSENWFFATRWATLYLDHQK